MKQEIIIEILKKWNPWEKKIDAGIKRESYIKKIYPYMERKEIIVIKGIRRSGKSTILKQLINELIKNKINKKQIVYLNLEDYNFTNELNLEFLENVLKAYLNYSKNKKKTYFFIDEIQKLENWEKWIRTKYDLEENIKFIVTGSSASLLSKELSTLLTGRNLSFKVFPLSFKEYLKFGKNKKLNEYLKYGGFPEVVLEKKEEQKRFILRQYFEDLLFKDIIDRYKIRNSKKVVEIARYLISTPCSKVSINKLSKVFGLSKTTVSVYINYMVNAFLLFEVNYFSYSAKIKHDVTRLPKFYVLDNGLINIANIKYSQNKGWMFENTVLLKLIEKFEDINYWSDLKSEVDFIVDKTAINVTATDKIPERELKGLDEFRKKHKQFSTLLITESITKNNLISLKDFLEDKIDFERKS